MIPHDKALHFIVGILIFTIFHFISISFALLMVFIIGFGKEIYDKYNQSHTSEVYDFVWTCVGGLIGLICTL